MADETKLDRNYDGYCPFCKAEVDYTDDCIDEEEQYMSRISSRIYQCPECKKEFEVVIIISSEVRINDSELIVE